VIAVLVVAGLFSAIVIATQVVGASKDRTESASTFDRWAAGAAAVELPDGARRATIDGAPVEVRSAQGGFVCRARHALGHGPRYEAQCFETAFRRFPLAGARLADAVRDDYVLHGDVLAARRRLGAAMDRMAPPEKIDPPRIEADGTHVSVTTSLRDGVPGIDLAVRLATALASDDLAQIAPLARALGGRVLVADVPPRLGLASIAVAGRIPIQLVPRIGPEGSVVTRIRAERPPERALAWRHPFDGPADAVLPVITGRVDVTRPLATLAPTDARIVLEMDAMEIVFPRLPTVDEARAALDLVEVLLTPPPAGPFR
jgi:hypothetical protein